MSAAVVPFNGAWGDSSYQASDDDTALRDARLIHNARMEGWQSQLLLAMLTVLDAKQRHKLDAVLAFRAPGSVDAEQALAIVRFRQGEPEHCGRVAEMLSRMGGGK